MRRLAVVLGMLAGLARGADAGVHLSILDLDLDLPSTYSSDGKSFMHYTGAGGLNISVDAEDIFDWSGDPDAPPITCADSMEDRPGLTAPPAGTPTQWRWYSREVSRYQEVSLMYCRDRHGSGVRIDAHLPDGYPEAEAQRAMGEIMRAIDRAIDAKVYVPPPPTTPPQPPQPPPTPPSNSATYDTSYGSDYDTTYTPPPRDTSYDTSYEIPPPAPKKHGFLGWPRLVVRAGQMDGLGDDHVPVIAGLEMTPLYIGRAMEKSTRGLVLSTNVTAGMADGVFVGDYHMAVGYGLGRSALMVAFAPALGIDRLGGGRLVTDGAFYYGAIAFARVMPVASLALEARVMPLDRGGDLDELRVDLTAVTSAALRGRVLSLGFFRHTWGDSVVVKGLSLGLSGTD